MKILKTLFNRLFKIEEINGGNRCPTYLFRWTLIGSRWCNVYLHHFVGDDWSRDMHDHPKRFLSIGLAGRYIEETPQGERVFDSPWVRTFPASHIHRLRMVNGGECWTLVIVPRAERDWGFWHEGRWIFWLDYVRGVASGIANLMKNCA